jgi:hypothetical protein
MLDGNGADFKEMSGINGARRGVGRVKEGREGRTAGKQVDDVITAVLAEVRDGLVEDSEERCSVAVEEFPFNANCAGAVEVRCNAGEPVSEP